MVIRMTLIVCANIMRFASAGFLTLTPPQRTSLLPRLYRLMRQQPNRLTSVFVAGALLTVILLMFMPLLPMQAKQPVALFTISLLVFLIPGLRLARYFEPDLNITYLTIAFFVSYSLYSAIAISLRSVGLGYNAFYIVFAVIVVASFVWPVPGPRTIDKPHLWTCLIIALLAVAYFQFPPMNDQGIFDNNIISSRIERNFMPSNWDVAVFGLSQVQPRMEANLYHAFYALLSEPAHTDPRLLTLLVANPFVGMFMLLAMTSLIWELSSQILPPIFCLSAVVFPFAIWYIGGGAAYWYNFRILNSPTLDKDFSLFVLLPSMTLCAWRVLGAQADVPLRWLGLMVLAAPAVIYSHSMTAVYFVINSAVLGALFVARRKLARIVVVGGLAAVIFVTGELAVNASDTHASIERLAQIDFAENPTALHFWKGHYVVSGNLENSLRAYAGTKIGYVTTLYIFQSNAVHLSAWFAIVWSVFLVIESLASSVRGGEVRPWTTGALTVAGSVLGAGSLIMLADAVEPLRPRVGIEAVALAIGGIALLATASWYSGDREVVGAAAEWRALRLQGVVMCALVGVFAGSSVILKYHVELWRGVERMHWFYFGLSPFAFVFWRVGAMADGTVRRLRKQLSRAVVGTPQRVASACSLLLFAGATVFLGLAIRADRQQPQPIALTGSATPKIYSTRIVANVLQANGDFVTDAPDSEAFVMFEYRDPVRVDTVRHWYSDEVWPAYQIRALSLQSSDNGTEWINAGTNAGPEGHVTIKSDGRDAHRYWRLIIIESGGAPEVVVGRVRIATTR